MFERVFLKSMRKIEPEYSAVQGVPDIKFLKLFCPPKPWIYRFVLIIRKYI